MPSVTIHLEQDNELEWLEEAAKEAAARFERQFRGKAGTGMARNRAGRYAEYMRTVAVATNLKRTGMVA